MDSLTNKYKTKAFSVLAVLNVVTGVFVENCIKSMQNDDFAVILEQTSERQNSYNHVKQVFLKADVDGSGRLGIEEFKKHLGDPYVQAYFRRLDIEVEGNGLESLFALLDFDGSGEIDIDEFCFGCSRLKGFARSLDLARVQHGQRRMYEELSKMSKDHYDTLGIIHDRMDAMSKVLNVVSLSPTSPHIDF